MRQYREFLKHRPNHENAHVALALILLRQQAGGDAVSHLERAVALDPQMAVAHLWLGVALADLGQIDRAIPHLRRAAELSPQDPRAQQALKHIDARRAARAATQAAP